MKAYKVTHLYSSDFITRCSIPYRGTKIRISKDVSEVTCARCKLHIMNTVT